MGIMRWDFLEKQKEIYPDVRNTYGYITKNSRIRLGLLKERYVDAYCIVGNFQAERLNYYWYQKQVRKYNRQIHKIQYGKNGVRKRNQAPYVVFGFRIFDKTTISAGITYKKLKLISKRKTFLTEKRLTYFLPTDKDGCICAIA